MKIIDAMKSDEVPRIVNGDRWMVWNHKGDTFVVYECTYGKKKTTVLIETSDEDIAVDILMQD